MNAHLPNRVSDSKRVRNAVASAVGLILIVGGVVHAQTKSQDWKFFSFAGGEPPSPDSLMVFYAGGDVRRLPAGHRQVWTKGLSAREVSDAFNHIDSQRALLDRIVKKVDSHYQPPYSKIHALTEDDRMDITAYEEIADEANLAPHMRVLFELDCPNHMTRQLSTWLQLRGEPQSSDQPTEWSHIAPETTAATLETLVCSST